MLRLSRTFRRTRLRPRAILLAFTLILLLDALWIGSSSPSPTRNTTLPLALKNEKIFIAAICRNSEYMLRLYWNRALVELVTALGPQNVFVSILESASKEDTKGALKDLEARLNEIGVGNRIILGIDSEEHSQALVDVPGAVEDKTGWIFTGRGTRGWELRRIPYLAALRNRAMEPLFKMSSERRFDRVLWINDVVFTTEDVTTLLSTREGDYAAVCALDFSSNPESYYDTFALRDSRGLKTATLNYPYFHSTASLSALTSLSPIPVQSCWNGLISLTASPFYHPKPLKFRGIPDSLAKSHLEGSECCLIHADNWQLRSQKGVWINPNVRVAYNATSYSRINGGREVRSEIDDHVDGKGGGKGIPGNWPWAWERIRGVWWHRFVRLSGERLKVWSENRVVEKRVKKWVSEGAEIGEVREEKGLECLINEMQVMFDDGWQHV